MRSPVQDFGTRRDKNFSNSSFMKTTPMRVVAALVAAVAMFHVSAARAQKVYVYDFLRNDVSARAAGMAGRDQWKVPSRSLTPESRTVAVPESEPVPYIGM